MPSKTRPLGTVTIVGVGLMGGSLGAALRERKLATVLGAGRDAARLDEARRRGLIDAGTTDLKSAAGESQVMVFCTPVDRIVAGVREAAEHCRPGTLLTDAGSVKAVICQPLAAGLPEGVEFLGSHPMAGSEKQGFEHSSSQLFESRLCILTPVPATSAPASRRLHEFWQSVGMRTCEMSPADHDAAVAEASHLPHLIASTVAATLRPAHRLVAASGFRDATRIAAGDPGLWAAILLGNADAILEALDRQSSLAAEFGEALRNRDAAALHRLLALGKAARNALPPT